MPLYGYGCGFRLICVGIPVCDCYSDRHVMWYSLEGYWFGFGPSAFNWWALTFACLLVVGMSSSAVIMYEPLSRIWCVQGTPRVWIFFNTSSVCSAEWCVHQLTLTIAMTSCMLCCSLLSNSYRSRRLAMPLDGYDSHLMIRNYITSRTFSLHFWKFSFVLHFLKRYSSDWFCWMACIIAQNADGLHYFYRHWLYPKMIRCVEYC